MNAMVPRRIVERALARGRPGPIGLPPMPVWSTDTFLSFADGNGNPYGPPPQNLIGPEGPAGDFQNFETRNRAIASVISPILTSIRVARYAAGYPLAYAVYVPGNSAGPMAFQDAGSNWWQLDTSGGELNLLWFGAKGDGVNDDAPPFQLAVTAGAYRKLVVPPPAVSFLLKSQVTVAAPISIAGAFREVTLVQSQASGHAFLVNTGLTGVEIRDFLLKRVGVPVAGNDGIHFTGQTERARLQGMWVEGFWNNYRLCGTSYSKLIDSVGNNAYNDSCQATNEDGVLTALQWSMLENLFQLSNGWGVHWISRGSGVAPVGPMVDWLSFANTAGGAFYDGSSGCPITAVRIGGLSFTGSEGYFSVKLDTYGPTDSQIDNVYTEINGLSNTGVGLGTAPSNQGGGFLLTANNVYVIINGGHAVGHAWSGVETSAARLDLTGTTIRGCCAANHSGEIAGIILVAGNANVRDCSSKANPIGLLAENDNHLIEDCDFTENTTTPLQAAVPLVLSSVANNRGVPWFTFTPVVAATGGVLTSASAVGSFQRSGNTYDFKVTVTITTNGSCSGLSISLPGAALTTTIAFGRSIGTGAMLQGYLTANSNLMGVFKYDNSYPGADGAVLEINGTYEAAA